MKEIWPVPPLPTLRVPVKEGVKRSWLAEATIDWPMVSPVPLVVEVAKVMALPVVVEKPEPRAVMPLLIEEVATQVGMPPERARTKPFVVAGAPTIAEFASV